MRICHLCVWGTLHGDTSCCQKVMESIVLFAEWTIGRGYWNNQKDDGSHMSLGLHHCSTCTRKWKPRLCCLIVKMGASESSMLAVEEKEACFKRGPELTTELYRLKSKWTSPLILWTLLVWSHAHNCQIRRHSKGEELPGLLTVVPDCLTYRVCLYR